MSVASGFGRAGWFTGRRVALVASTGIVIVLLNLGAGAAATARPAGLASSNASSLVFVACASSTPTVTTQAELDDAIVCYNNQTPAGDHTITLGADITHSGATPTITQNDPGQTLLISGVEHTVTGPGANTVAGEVDLFSVNGAGPVTFDDLTVAAADYNAIRVLSGTVVIGSTRIEDNGWNGISVSGGDVTIANSTIINNAHDFGVRVEGGSVTTVNSSITDNTHGLYLVHGLVTVKNSTVANNDIGVFVLGGSMSILGSTITNNTDLGLRAYAGSVAISNSTITNNTGQGVGAHGGSVAISNSTLAANNTGVFVSGGSATVVSTVVAGNMISDCSGGPTNGGNSFAGDATCGGFALLSAGSLGVLGDNGCGAPTPFGCVSTLPLVAGSNAMGAGVCAGVVVGADPAGGSNFVTGDLTTDQRGSGYPRTIGLGCDVGAFELDPCPNPTSTPSVTTAVELDRAIICYNNQQPAGDHTITFGADIAHTGATPAISQPDGMSGLTIEGAGYTLSGPGGNSIPELVDLITVGGSGPVTVRGLTIRGADQDAIQLNSGKLTITDSTLDSNTSGVGVRAAGGVLEISNTTMSRNFYGIGVLATSTVSVSGSTITDNTIEGVSVAGGWVSVSNAVLDGNARGMGVGGGYVFISSSTITNNASDGILAGGGVLSLSNSTLDNNNYGVRQTLSGVARVSNSTIRNNVNGLRQEHSGSISVNSSLIDSTNFDCLGTIGNIGANFSNDATCDGFDRLSTGSLADMADNGCAVATPSGCVKTAQLVAGSNAIGAGDCVDVVVGLDPAGAFVTGDLTTDQRGAGFARTRGDGCDAGAFERDVCENTTPTVTSEQALDDAIACYNAQQPVGNHTITFGADIGHASGTPTIIQGDSTKSLTIDGGGHTLAGPASALGAFDLIGVDGPGPVFVTRLTITAADDDGIQVSSGTATIADAIITGNDFGYGVYVTGGSMSISTSTVSDNFAGVVVDAGVATISNTDIQGNGLLAGGTGVAASGGSVSISNSTIEGNQQGFAVDGGSVSISNSTVVSNQARGVAVFGGSVTVSNATVSGNGTYGIFGGGGSLSVVSSIVAGNTIAACSGAVLDGGNNFTGDPSCAGFTALSAAPYGGLSDNGCGAPGPLGCVKTIPLLAGSNAIGGGVCAGVVVGADPAGGPAFVTGDLVTDQRGAGFPRTVGLRCDAGAFESAVVGGAGFVALAPSRILDSRPEFPVVGPNNVLTTPWGQGVTRTVTVTGVGGVPASGVTAVAIHVTSVAPTANSFLTVWAEGLMPLAASKNYGITAGGPFGYAALTNDLLIVPVAPDGTIKVYNDAGTVHLVFDVIGYYSTTEGATFTELAPSRILDSRPEFPVVGPNNVLTTPWGQGVTRTVTVTGVGGVPATGVTAVAIHVTSVAPTANSFLTVWAEGLMPLAASKNYGITAGGPFGYAALTNDLLIVPVAADGTIKVYNDKGTVHLVFDVVGYYSTTDGATFTELAPSRILDSRPEFPVAGPNNVLTTPWGQGVTRTVPVTGVGGVPATGVTAVAIHVTSVAPTANSFLTVWAEGLMPLAASKNYGVTAGGPFGYAALTNDLLIVPVAADGSIKVYNDAGTVHLVFDVIGYYD